MLRYADGDVGPNIQVIKGDGEALAENVVHFSVHLAIDEENLAETVAPTWFGGISVLDLADTY
jgi:hypothetical protein